MGAGGVVGAAAGDTPAFMSRAACHAACRGRAGFFLYGNAAAGRAHSHCAAPGRCQCWCETAVAPGASADACVLKASSAYDLYRIDNTTAAAPAAAGGAAAAATDVAVPVVARIEVTNRFDCCRHRVAGARITLSGDREAQRDVCWRAAFACASMACATQRSYVFDVAGAAMATAEEEGGGR